MSTTICENLPHLAYWSLIAPSCFDLWPSAFLFLTLVHWTKPTLTSLHAPAKPSPHLFRSSRVPISPRMSAGLTSPIRTQVLTGAHLSSNVCRANISYSGLRSCWGSQSASLITILRAALFTFVPLHLSALPNCYLLHLSTLEGGSAKAGPLPVIHTAASQAPNTLKPLDVY